MPNRGWLLLLHQIPPKPPYFRARILRRLEQVGALPVKNSAYLLPDNEETLEDFEWICREIKDQGGAAWLFRAETLVGMSAEQTEEAFRQLHASEYEELIAQGRLVAEEITQGSDEVFSTWRKLRRRGQELKRVDFFDSPIRQSWEELMAKIEQQIESVNARPREAERTARRRVWVTRKGVKVDRIGSAWLIRRFIDPEATFRFVDPKEYSHDAAELRFDMFEGEYTHQGDLCTFEVLIANHGLSADSALVAVAEIVHDIDLKEARYQRPETPGLARMIDGLARQTQADELRLERGGNIFESLYQSFQ